MIASLALILFVIASAPAMPDECFSKKIDKFDALKATHFKSHCLVQSVLEDSANPPDSAELRYGPKFDCSYKSLDGLDEDESMVVILACLLQKSRRAGDPPHLSPQIVKQRITSAANDFYEDIDDTGDCSAEKLEEVTYEEAHKSSDYGHCIVIQTLLDLTHPEDLDNINF